MKARPPESLVICTIGHSTRTSEEFVDILKTYLVSEAVDVRRIPRSRRNPQFNSDTLRQALHAAGIEYLPMPGLGGLRRPRPDSANMGWRNRSFRGYADYMQTPEFAENIEQLIALARLERIALMCAEAVPWRCHRLLISDALVARGVEVIEILSKTSFRAHTLTPWARLEGQRVTYPSETTT